jgi:predicted CopG family antitoxin
MNKMISLDNNTWNKVIKLMKKREENNFSRLVRDLIKKEYEGLK